MIDARSIRDDGPVLLGFAVASGLAWLALIAWSRPPGGEQAAHHAHHAHHAAQAGGSAPEIVVVLAAWGLMTVAMMLPAAAPFFARFRRSTASRPAAGGLTGFAVAGYLAVWMLFGAALVAGDLALHQAFDRAPSLTPLAGLVAPTVIAVAGLWQLSTASRYHLYRPYVPRAAGPGSDRAARTRAFRCGFGHGLDCAGSCGPLMLLMFALGRHSIAAMALLGAVMVVEKNTAWGHRLRAPIGIALLAAALVMLVV